MSLTISSLTRIGEALYGPRWSSDLARDLNVSYRTVLNWRQGVCRFPDDLVNRLRPIVRDRIERAERARSLLWSKANG